MTGVVHVVDDVVVGELPLTLATALHDPGRPQVVLAGSASPEAERALGARLRLLRDIRVPGAGLNIVRRVAAVLELARVVDSLVDKLRSPVVVHTHHGAAGTLGRLAARSMRGVVNVHSAAESGDLAEGTASPAAGPPTMLFSADIVVHASETHRSALGRRGANDRVIVAGIDPAPYAALIDNAAERTRARASLGVASGARLVVTNAPRAADAWRARDARGDVLLLGPRQSSAHLDQLAAADVALFVGAPLHDVLAALAAGLPVVVVGREHEAELAWAKRAHLLDGHRFTSTGGTGDAHDASSVGHTLSRVLSARPLVASTRARHAKLPRELTMAGALAMWRELYDELVGPPRPTGELARRRPRRTARPSRR